MKTKRVLSLALALLMLATCFLTSCGGEKKFDYTKEDLTKYLTLSSDAWTDQTVTIEEPDKVDQSLIDNYVRYSLSQYSIEVYLDDHTVEEDDVIALYYRGTVMENGTEKDILGNFATAETQYDMKGDVLKLGADFTKALIGIKPEHKLEALTSGKIEKDHILYVTYSYNYKVKTEGADGAEVEKWKTVKEENAVRFDLFKLAENDLYGEGFVDKLIGKEIGASHTIETSFDADGDGKADAVTFNLNVTRAHKENPVSFKITYPKDYSALESVKGKEVTFYVCVNGVAGTADELLTEEVLKDKLKYKPADDDEYKNDLKKSFLKMAEEYLTENRESTIRSSALAELWDDLLEKANLIKYPESVVKGYYDSMVAEETAYYEQYSEQAKQDASLTKFSSLGDFIIYRYSLDKNTKYEEYLRKQAEDAVKYNLVYYTIVREAKLEVTDDEYKAKYQEYIDAIIYQEQTTYYQNSGQWIEITEEDLIENYGEEYIESYIRQSLLTEELNEYLYQNLTVEFKTAEKK